MPMKPSKYEYVPPTQISGAARDFTTKVEIAGTPNGWMGMIHSVTGVFPTSDEAQRKLREELLRIVAVLEGPLK